MSARKTGPLLHPAGRRTSPLLHPALQAAQWLSAELCCAHPPGGNQLGALQHRAPAVRRGWVGSGNVAGLPAGAGGHKVPAGGGGGGAGGGGTGSRGMSETQSGGDVVRAGAVQQHRCHCNQGKATPQIGIRGAASKQASASPPAPTPPPHPPSPRLTRTAAPTRAAGTSAGRQSPPGSAGARSLQARCRPPAARRASRRRRHRRRLRPRPAAAPPSAQAEARRLAR